MKKSKKNNKAKKNKKRLRKIKKNNHPVNQIYKMKIWDLKIKYKCKHQLNNKNPLPRSNFKMFN